MRSVWIFYQKEILESLRSYKLLWIPVVFIILGIMQPLTTYYMPEILKASGNVPPGLLEGYVIPGAAVVMSQALGQYGSMGMLVLALATMNSLSGERHSGTVEMVLVRPLTPATLVIAKWAALLTLLMIALGLGAIAAGYYIEQLIGTLSWSTVLAAASIYGLWLLCAVSMTLLFSAFLRAPVAAFLGLLLTAGLALAHGLLPSWLDWSPAALPDLSAQVLLQAGSVSLMGPCLSAGVLILICIAGASLMIRRNILPN